MCWRWCCCCAFCCNLKNVLKSVLQDAWQTFFQNVLFSTRRDVFQTAMQDVFWICKSDIFKASQRHLAKTLSKVSFTIALKTILLRCLKRCLCRMSYIPLYEMSFRQLCKMQYAKNVLSLKIHSQRNYGPESISLFVIVEKSSNSANRKHCLRKVVYQYIYQKFAS